MHSRITNPVSAAAAALLLLVAAALGIKAVSAPPSTHCPPTTPRNIQQTPPHTILQLLMTR